MLLFMTRIPHPPIGGDKVRCEFFLERLARHCDVHLVTLSDRPLDPETDAYLRRHCARHDVFHVPRWRHRLGALRALFGRLPLQVGYYQIPEVVRHVAALAGTVDFALAITQRGAPYLFGFPKPSFLDMMDSQTLICRRGSRHNRSLKWRAIQTLEAPRIEAFERGCLARFLTTFFVNRDEELFYGEPERTRWLPNAVDEALLERARPERIERAICFLGRLDTQPNADAVAWFAEHVLPRLPADLPWHVIGPDAGPRLHALAQRFPNLRLTGRVPDPWEIVSRCRLMVAPMQTGGGSQYKILEAMTLGVPVVTTGHGAAPIIGARDGEHLVVADDSAGMAAQVLRLLDDPARAAAIGAAARGLIRSSYTWDAVEKRLMACLEERIGPLG